MWLRWLKQWRSFTPPQRRLARTALVFAATYAVALLGLANFWYSASSSDHFHFFDDSREWLGMDKLGHVFSAFHFALFGSLVAQAAGITPRASARWGAILAFATMLAIEVLDGFSPKYGASIYDLAANAIGAALVPLQQWAFGKMAFIPKFSFHPTAFAPLRPFALGSGFLSEFLKDYNGQTYWLTADLNTLTGLRIFPRWLRLAVGYGAEGILGGEENTWQNPDGSRADFTHIARYQQLFLSLDIDWGQRPLPYGVLRAPWHWLNLFKFPAPTLEWNAAEGFRWHWLYF